MYTKGCYKNAKLAVCTYNLHVHEGAICYVLHAQSETMTIHNVLHKLVLVSMIMKWTWHTYTAYISAWDICTLMLYMDASMYSINAHVWK